MTSAPGIIIPAQSGGAGADNTEAFCGSYLNLSNGQKIAGVVYGEFHFPFLAGMVLDN
jgi:hypothetical protein